VYKSSSWAHFGYRKEDSCIPVAAARAGSKLSCRWEKLLGKHLHQILRGFSLIEEYWELPVNFNGCIFNDLMVSLGSKILRQSVEEAVAGGSWFQS
jgi:hypothetical protein